MRPGRRPDTATFGLRDPMGVIGADSPVLEGAEPWEKFGAEEPKAEVSTLNQARTEWSWIMGIIHTQGPPRYIRDLAHIVSL
ncbi:uncharacterized protein LDX57_007803 [Aspergillus melleus]|uniref:uncharacterized protein n=1 Tax=Aspergillus melleus TaxID=138277 RepID=UPI001E8E4DE3|nr:uncharacterized protein LDX57_007803 [Aspergillus melleus]KAH8430133.1 hypothetical protein LDX57_007803 [Aspergillus melleus]